MIPVAVITLRPTKTRDLLQPVCCCSDRASLSRRQHPSRRKECHMLEPRGLREEIPLEVMVSKTSLGFGKSWAYRRPSLKGYSIFKF